MPLIGGFILTWNRLGIILFCFARAGRVGGCCCAHSTFGLHMRAVTQNRPMAAAMGIRTGRVDALTFGLGSGIAGIAGVALSQIGNVGPNLGQIYIVDCFMVVVFGGVGSLWGTLVGAMQPGHRQQVAGALRRRGARQDRRAGVHHPVHPEPSARPVRAQGPGGGELSRMTDARRSAALPTTALLARLRALACVLLLVVRAAAQLVVPDGSRRCICRLHGAAARQISLLRACWRWRSIWSGAIPASFSLGHGAFFALGGYAMGMYLMRQIGTRGVYRQSGPAGFHGVPRTGRSCPGTGTASIISAFAAGDGRAGAGPARLGLRLVRLPLARHRRLSLDHHPGADLCAAARLLPQRHGLRRQ